MVGGGGEESTMIIFDRCFRRKTPRLLLHTALGSGVFAITPNFVILLTGELGQQIVKING
jgi:hypothetical protein